MQVHQIFNFNSLRNFTYFIEYAHGKVICLDPNDIEVVEKQLIEKSWQLTHIINTHEHFDHTAGNEFLSKKYACEVMAHENGQGKIPAVTRWLKKGEKLTFFSETSEDYELLVLDTPGHTFAHLCLLLSHKQQAKAVFSGDTLFNAGVGHCRSGGSPTVLHETIRDQFETLDDNVLLYPGHDYLLNNLKFSLSLEAENQQAQAWLEKAELYHEKGEFCQCSIGDEKTYNLFMRRDSKNLLQNLKENHSLNSTEDKQVFLKLRELRDQW